MTDRRIGSLCSGTGALDMAVHSVVGAEPAWFCQYEPPDKDGKPDRWQFAARILAHHWPEVPNHGDITQVDWAAVEKVEWVIAGWPCENISLAGRREGLVAGVQSGLWFDVVKAIRAQIAMREPGEPGPFIFLENVRGLLSARADSDVEPCPWCLGDVEDQPALRALGAVLGDLAALGLDAEWLGVPASHVGACHARFREFVLAWPAASHPPLFGHERGGSARGRRNGFADHGETASHANHAERVGEQGEQPGDSAAAWRCDGVAAYAERGRRNGWPRDPERDKEGRTPSAGTGESGVQWGPYQPAIERHRRVFGRSAPEPTQPGRSGREQWGCPPLPTATPASPHAGRASYRLRPPMRCVSCSIEPVRSPRHDFSSSSRLLLRYSGVRGRHRACPGVS